MNTRRLCAVCRKEFIHIRRDIRSLAMAVLVPVVLLLLFGFALTLDVKNVPLAVWDQSRTPASRELVSRFTGSEYFRLQASITGYAEARRLLDSGGALMALVIPVDFSARLESEGTATVQVLLDGTDANTATLARGYAEGIVLGYSQNILLERLDRFTGGGRGVPVDFRPRVWYNAELESRHYIIPGLIAVILMVIAALLTSLTVSREWETGTMEQLIATPVKGTELVLGKLIPYCVIGAVDALLVGFMGEFIFDVPLRGSIPLLVAAVIVFLVGALSQGLFLSIATRSQLLSSQLAIVTTYLPALLLSGFVFDIRNMPTVVQGITYIIPTRYFITLLKGIYLKGIGLDILAPAALMMTAFSLLMVGLSIRKFRKKMV
ncbi:MAG: ABC transporter permease [Acidobacteria bacterium]|nr:ABC transporter permease [Acidobacteriota bacterium]